MKLVRNLSLALALFTVGAPNWAAQHDQHMEHHMLEQRMDMMQAMMVDRPAQTPAKP